MFRTIIWTVVYLLMLGAVSIRVEYSDGLTITLKGWWV